MRKSQQQQQLFPAPQNLSQSNEARSLSKVHYSESDMPLKPWITLPGHKLTIIPGLWNWRGLQGFLVSNRSPSARITRSVFADQGAGRLGVFPHAVHTSSSLHGVDVVLLPESDKCKIIVCSSQQRLGKSPNVGYTQTHPGCFLKKKFFFSLRCILEFRLHTNRIFRTRSIVKICVNSTYCASSGMTNKDFTKFLWH